MKLITRLILAVALLTASGFALAAPGHGDHGRGGRGHHGGPGHGSSHYDNRRHDNRYRGHGYDYGRGYRYGYRPAYGYPVSYGHGYRPVVHTRWQRGYRYYGPSYVVSNYGYYHLRQPPRGYHWVRADDNSYLLVAIATGIILDMALQ